MITLSTIIYEKNYLNIFNESNWFWLFNNNSITKKQLIVNNISSIDDFTQISNEWKKKFDFDIFYCEDIKDECLNHFGVTVPKENIGYVYTIPFYVTLFCFKTNFLFHVSEDCMRDIKISNEFFINSKFELIKNDNCFFTTLPWIKDNHKMSDGMSVGEEEMKRHNIIKNNDNFSNSYEFSDQVFFTSKLKSEKINFNSPESHSYNGPRYCGGICFEKKIKDFFIFSKSYRSIFEKNNYYLHI